MIQLSHSGRYREGDVLLGDQKTVVGLALTTRAGLRKLRLDVPLVVRSTAATDAGRPRRCATMVLQTFSCGGLNAMFSAAPGTVASHPKALHREQISGTFVGLAAEERIGVVSANARAPAEGIGGRAFLRRQG